MKKCLVLTGVVAGAHFTLCCVCMAFFRNSGFGLLPEHEPSRFSHAAYTLLPVCPAPVRSFGFVESIGLFLLNGSIWGGGIALLVCAVGLVRTRRAARIAQFRRWP
jgi:hypothetical protein